MGKDENKPTGKEIADKYRFETVRKLGHKEIIKVYEELYKLYSSALSKIDVLEAKLEGTSNTSGAESTKKPFYTDYDPNWKGIEKVIYILKENKRVMLSSEILMEISRIDAELIKQWDKPYPALVKYISRGVKFSRIIQTKLPTQGIFYGLPEWFDNNGILNKRYCKS
jgi:hypothetical protein